MAISRIRLPRVPNEVGVCFKCELLYGTSIKKWYNRMHYMYRIILMFSSSEHHSGLIGYLSVSYRLFGVMY